LRSFWRIRLIADFVFATWVLLPCRAAGRVNAALNHAASAGE
jgi:hypothetical protein